MKRAAIVVVSLAVVLATATAESRPLVSTARLGGAGGPDFKLTLLDGTVAMLGGGPAYVVVDGSLWLGLGGWYVEGDADDGLFIGYAGPSATLEHRYVPAWSCCLVPRGGAEGSGSLPMLRNGRKPRRPWL